MKDPRIGVLIRGVRYILHAPIVSEGLYIHVVGFSRDAASDGQRFLVLKPRYDPHKMWQQRNWQSSKPFSTPPAVATQASLDHQSKWMKQARCARLKTSRR